jgi:hypothetical protein
MGGQNRPLICTVFLGIILLVAGQQTTITDYAIDVYLNGYGYVDVPPIPGIGSEASFDIQFYQKDSTTPINGCLFELGAIGTSSYLKLCINSNRVTFQLGSTQIPTNIIYGIQSGWHTITVVIDQDGASSNRSVEIYVDGVSQAKSNLVNIPLPFIDRSGRIGSNKGGQYLPFLGMIDNFIIWKVPRTKSEIQTLVSKPN